MQPDKYKPQNCKHLTNFHRHGYPVHDGYEWFCKNEAEGDIYLDSDNIRYHDYLKNQMIANK